MWRARHLDNAFNKETKLSSYVVAGTGKADAGFLPVLGIPNNLTAIARINHTTEEVSHRHASIEADGG